jgi:hypothetical protein
MILCDWNLDLTVDSVLRGQGADPAVIRARRPRLVEIADWALKEGVPLLQPVVLAREMPVAQARHDRVILEGGATLSGELIIRHLARAERVILMVCSIGDQLESVASELLPTDPLQGLALDGLGTAAVEALAAQASSYFEARAHQEGLKTSVPLSPGLVGWPVDPGQRQVFAPLDAGQIGVKLHPSGMMTPTKSVTQVLGVGAVMDESGCMCDYCSLRETCKWGQAA